MGFAKGGPDYTGNNGKLLYLYCVAEPGTGAHQLLQQRSLPGLEPEERLFPIEAAGLVAAVSHVPAQLFQEEAFNALLQDFPRLAPFAVRHGQVIQALKPGTPALIPISLGTVYHSPAGVAQLLRGRAREFRQLCNRVRGREEWTVKVVRDVSKLAQRARGASEQLRQLGQEETRSGPGRAYLLRKRQEGLLESEVGRLTTEALDEIGSKLAQLAVDTHIDPLPHMPSEAPSLALKASFLVMSSKAEGFSAAVGDLAQRFAPLGLQVEVTGPWAPYSFVGDWQRAREPQESK